MEDYTQKPAHEQTPTACPECGAVGAPVDTQTVKAMLAVSLMAVKPSGYRFCATSDCPVVYYSQDSTQSFHEADLREMVYQKHPLQETVLVCYCFQHTLGAIWAEVAATGSSTIWREIVAGTKSGHCACDIRNPQGACCLGNVGRIVRRMEAELDQL